MSIYAFSSRFRVVRILFNCNDSMESKAGRQFTSLAWFAYFPLGCDQTVTGTSDDHNCAASLDSELNCLRSSVVFVYERDSDYGPVAEFHAELALS